MKSKSKSRSITVLLLCGLLLLTGCGKSEAPVPDTSPVQQTVIEETAAPDVNETPASPVSEEEPAPSAENEADAGVTGESTVSFGLNDTIAHDGLCEMSGLYSEVLDDDAMAEGWHYYYTDTDESPANTIRWEISGDNYTTAEVLFTVKNTSDVPQTFGDRINARMIYLENGDSPATVFDGTVFQQNPGQSDERGTVIMWSTKPVALEPGESANVSFRFDIPHTVYEKVYATATGESTGIRETCEFSFGDGATYVIDLTQVLIPASRYEG